MKTKMTVTMKMTVLVSNKSTLLGLSKHSNAFTDHCKERKGIFEDIYCLLSLKNDLGVQRAGQKLLRMAGTPLQQPQERRPQSLHLSRRPAHHRGLPPDRPLVLSLRPAQKTQARARLLPSKQRSIKALNPPNRSLQKGPTLPRRLNLHT